MHYLDYLQKLEEAKKFPKKQILINTSLMEALKKHYGKIEGERQYLQMRSGRVKGYIKGMRTAKAHHHTVEYKPKYINWKKG